MDVFEYATLVLFFEDSGEGDTKITKGFLDLSTFESDGEKPGIRSIKTFELDGEFTRQEHRETIENFNGYYRWIEKLTVDTTNNFPLRVMAPYLAMLGKKGWEVVEYKTNAQPALGQVLLKRKIQKD